MRSPDDDIIILSGLLYILKKKRRRRRPKITWVNNYLSQRRTKGRFQKDFEDMRQNVAIFKENFHMSPIQFDQLLEMVHQDLQPRARTRPDAISPTEQLCLTLEFLASGSLQRHIASTYRVSKQRLGPIIEKTCTIIYNVLKQRYLKPITKENWIKNANEFNARWNFPNCLGAIDGKHIAIKCPENGGSSFNHKGYHSIVLMAVADAEYRFIYIDIGAYGSEGDSSVFQASEFGEALVNNQLSLPADCLIGDHILPFVFLTDDAFPLHKHIMKPYQPNRRNKELTKEQRILNYRLSRARRCVENSFGILSARWICLARTLFLNPDRAQKIVAACCLLHNFMISDHKEDYSPPGFADYYDDNGVLVEGAWRKLVETPREVQVTQANQGRPPSAAVINRDRFSHYVNSPIGRLEWQDELVNCD